MPPSTDWQAQAACAGRNAELFFPIGQAGPAVERTFEAKVVCTGCAVREPCLQWSLDLGVDDGVWGGLDPDERRKLRFADRRRLSQGN